MKAILLLLSLSMIWRGSLKDENGNFSIPYIISYVCALIAWGITMFGNVVYSTTFSNYLDVLHPIHCIDFPITI